MPSAKLRRLVAFALPAFLGALVPGSPGTLVAQQPDTSLLESAAGYYAGLDSYCMDFRQELFVTLLDETHLSGGTICQQGGGRLRMDFDDPEGDLVVGDGEFLWVFFPSVDEEQVLRFGLDSAEGAFDIRREFLEDPLTKYEVADAGGENVGGRASRGFRLTPRERTRYLHATVWIDVETMHLRAIDIAEVGGSERRMTLSGLRDAPELSVSDFEFQVPRGVRVVAR